MSNLFSGWSRRRFLKGAAFSAAAVAAGAYYTVPGAFAQELVRTPAQMEGPFYPDRLPLDTDNDLLRINDAITPAVGEVTWLSGRLLDAGIGTGRNCAFYPPDAIVSGIDTSPAMLARASRKRLPAP